jgi:16S rRNA (uracil1498-N3)-methyltransferase
MGLCGDDMHIRRFLVPPGSLEQDEVDLPPPEAEHARRVLRLKTGDPVVLMDGQGSMAQAVISRISRQKVICQVQKALHPNLPQPRLVICPGLLKGPAMDTLAVKLTELAVDQVRPLLAQHSVSRPKDPAARVERWQRLAGQALKQCRAARAPIFTEPASLADVLGQAPAAALGLVLDEAETGLTLAQALGDASGRDEVWALVGPEGGFAPDEVNQAREAGFIACGLPGTILRAETASLALAAVIRFGWRKA